MKINIYQVNLDRDHNHVAFMGHEMLDQFQDSSEIDSAIYDRVFSGEVPCGNVEDVYRMFNIDHPEGYAGRSLSVSDVVEVLDSRKAGFYFCDMIGFRKVAFEPEQTRKRDQTIGRKWTMNRDER